MTAEPQFTLDLYSPDFSFFKAVPRGEAEALLREWRGLQVLPRRLRSPLFVLWETTYRCNLNCSFCYNRSPRRVSELTSREAMSLISELADTLRPFSVCVSGGEPTLRPDYLKILASLHAAGITVATITNGWTMSEELASGIASHAHTAQVSLDGPRPEVHDAIRGRRGAFERALNALRLLRGAGIAELSLSFVATRENIRDFPDMVDLARRYEVDRLRVQPVVPTGRGDLESVPTPEQLRWLEGFLEREVEGAAEEGLRIEYGDPAHHIRAGLLIGLTLAMNITADGHVGFTPYFPFSCGNVRRHPIHWIWTERVSKAWRHPVVRSELSKVRTVYDFYKVSGASSREPVPLDGWDEVGLGE